MPHSDWYSHEATNYRFLTCLLYFNPSGRRGKTPRRASRRPRRSWDTDVDGGGLRLHLERGVDGFDGTNPHVDVAPKAGRLVVFFARTITHEVLQAHVRNRWAYTLWVERMPGDDPPRADAE